MRDQTADVYLVLANHIRDIHHQIASRITESKNHSPKWTVQAVMGEPVIVEISPLLGIAKLLESLASTTAQPTATVSYLENDQ